jgi:hypothetical protein
MASRASLVSLCSLGGGEGVCVSVSFRVRILLVQFRDSSASGMLILGCVSLAAPPRPCFSCDWFPVVFGSASSLESPPAGILFQVPIPFRGHLCGP